MSLHANIRRALVWGFTSGKARENGEKKVQTKKEKFAVYPLTRSSFHYNVGCRFLCLTCQQCLQACCSRQNCLILAHSDVLPVSQQCEHTAWCPQSSCIFPHHTAETHILCQRTAVMAQTEVEGEDWGGRAKPHTLCHLARAAMLFSFYFCMALPHIPWSRPR